jgi:prevent-host-death family protein
MSKVGIAVLKARLSEHLRAVRSGRSVTVVDRATPIARLVPYEEPALEIRKASRRIKDLRLPPAPKAATDSLAVLLDDRRRR